MGGQVMVWALPSLAWTVLFGAALLARRTNVGGCILVVLPENQLRGPSGIGAALKNALQTAGKAAQKKVISYSSRASAVSAALAAPLSTANTLRSTLTNASQSTKLNIRSTRTEAIYFLIGK